MWVGQERGKRPTYLAAPGEEVRGSEIDRLGDVEVVVEAGVVGLGEGDDELAGVLLGLVHGDALLRGEQERGGWVGGWAG